MCCYILSILSSFPLFCSFRDIIDNSKTEIYEGKYAGGEMPYRLERIHHIVQDPAPLEKADTHQWFIADSSYMYDGMNAVAAISSVYVNTAKRELSNLSLLVSILWLSGHVIIEHIKHA